jgi:tetratricopeptide (TPR) repeat protein/mono/diheme cytochrome c family protein
MRAATTLILLGSFLSSLFCTTDAVAAQAAAPTFNRDIAPLLWERCAACHRPGASAPFSLVEYRDVVPRARQIAEAVRTRAMPPWLPEAGDLTFANERRLTAAEIGLIEQWVKQGAKQGDRGDLPMRPTWTEGWQLGTPDLVVSLPAPYQIGAGEGDSFRAFVLPVPLSSSRYVRGVEVRPGNPAVVHHASLAVDRTRGSRDLDTADPGPGFAGGMISEGVRSPESRAIGWTPGMTTAFEPEGMAWRLDPGSDFVVQLHMLPAAGAPVQPSIGLYFTDQPPVRQPMDFKLGSKAIEIPAGDANYAIEDSFVLPVGVDLLSVYPHAHYLARRMTANAMLPDGRVQSLLAITEWDFHWQDEYRYKAPIALPAGTRITMSFSYDNSAANQNVRGRRPVPVQYGPRSSDEMGDLWLRFVPRTPDDYLTLASAYRSRELRKDIDAGTALVARRPTDASARHALGLAYLRADRLAEAIAQINEALRLEPTHLEARNNLGHALQLGGKPFEALVEFREAARLAPGNDVVRVNLANALQDVGEIAASIDEYKASLGLNPLSADAHNGLGTALAALGRFAEAEEQFQEALKLRPDHPDAQRNLKQVQTLR